MTIISLDLPHTLQLFLHGTTVTTTFRMTPSDHRSTSKGGSEISTSGLDLLHILQLILHGTTVTTSRLKAPGDHGSITKDCSESATSGLDLLHIFQLVLHGTAVTTSRLKAPGDHGPITKDCSESAISGLDLLHIFQLVLHGTTVTATFGIAPGDHRSITKDGSKSGLTRACLNPGYLQGSCSLDDLSGSRASVPIARGSICSTRAAARAHGTSWQNLNLSTSLLTWQRPKAPSTFIVFKVDTYIPNTL